MKQFPKFLKNLSFPVLIIAMLAIPVVNTGCIAVAAVGAGAGAFAYLRGTLDSHLAANLSECLPAIRKGVPRLGLIKVKEISDQEKAKFTFRDSLDTKITVNLHQRSHGVTEVTIRVGQLGNESRSIQILNSITRELKPAASTGN